MIYPCLQMTRRRRIDEIVYPWGNRTPAKIVDVTFASDEPRYTIKFLAHNIADFGWYKHLIFWKGYVIDDLKEEQLFDDPIR